MFYHSKELQYNARVSKPDPRFARLMLEQFGGGNGELSASMQYFLQAFGCHNPYPDKYDLLMDIATEELGHLEIVGATIQMLLTGVNGKLKDVADKGPVFEEGFDKDDFIHQAFSIDPQFGILSAGGPSFTNCNGVPWQSGYISANGDLTVDLRSDLAAEARAKIVYEYLMKFTDDPYVLDTLNFLLTREVAHYQQFQAALESIRPNFPMGVRQSDPRYSNIYSNHSADCKPVRASWNEGKSLGLNEEWRFVDCPRKMSIETNGLTEVDLQGTDRTLEKVKIYDKELGEERKAEVCCRPKKEDCGKSECLKGKEGVMEWCCYDKAKD